MNSNFERLVQRCGAYSLPYLVHLYDASHSLYFVNNNSDIEYMGNVYKAATFGYSPNPSALGFDGGGKLEITAKDNLIVDMAEEQKNVRLDVVGGINERGIVQEIRAFRHTYGTIGGNRKTVTFTFDKDDRLGMMFPSMIWGNQNNRGNA